MTEQIINPTNDISPEKTNILEYDPTKDETVFISLPEEQQDQLQPLKNRVVSNTVVAYDEFIKDDGY